MGMGNYKVVRCHKLEKGMALVATAAVGPYEGPTRCWKGSIEVAQYNYRRLADVFGFGYEVAEAVKGWLKLGVISGGEMHTYYNKLTHVY